MFNKTRTDILLSDLRIIQNRIRDLEERKKSIEKLPLSLYLDRTQTKQLANTLIRIFEGREGIESLQAYGISKDFIKEFATYLLKKCGECDEYDQLVAELAECYNTKNRIKAKLKIT